METSGQSLLDFWAWSARKGLVPNSVANDLRASSKEVLSVEDNWQTLDIKTLEVDYLLVRFDNLRKFKFKPQSLSAYKSRFKKARKLYLAYLENPSGWHYPAAKPRRAKVAAPTGMPPDNADNPLVNAAAAEIEMRSDQSSQVLQFPIRAGFTARLELPADLTKEEAARLASYLQLIVP